MNLDRKTLRSIFLGIAGCIVLVWLLNKTDRVMQVYNFVKGLFMPFAIGAVIAFILNVPLRGIERRLKFIKKTGPRRALALVLTLTMISLVLALLFRLLMPQVLDTVYRLIEQFPDFLEQFKEKMQGFVQSIPELNRWLNKNASLDKINWSDILGKVLTFAGNSAVNIIEGLFTAIGSIYSGIFNAVIAVVFAIYCLFRKEILAVQGKKLLYSFVKEKYADYVVRVFRLTNQTFSNFISGQCLEAVILGSLFAVAMTIFRMPYVALVSMLIGITALIPIVGAFIGCILGAFFILVSNPMQAVWFVVMFLILQQFENNVIYPKVVGKSVGLPGMWVLVAVTVGGELMGVVGMLLMIPVVSVLYTLLREITAKRLAKKGIPADKLVNAPMASSSRFEKTKEKFFKKKKNEKVPETPEKTEE